MKQPLISVVIPTYNRKLLLPRCLDSVVNQTYQKFEIIIVDDGSSDETSNLILQQYPNINFIQTSNRGVSAARNTGIKAAKGEWVALLDSDDAWDKKKLQHQITALEEQPDYKICHTNEIWIRNGLRVNPHKKHAKSGGWIFEHCLPLCVISPSSVLIHKEIFADIGYFDETMPACEDYDMWLRITAKYSVLYLEQLLTIKYGGHEDQLSHQHWAMDRFRIDALVKLLENADLAVSQCEKVWNELQRKIRIYQKGADKREKLAEVNKYNELLRKLADILPFEFNRSTCL